MAEIGSLVVDLTLKSAEFINDLAKSSNAVAANTKKMTDSMTRLQKTSEAVSRALAAIISVRAATKLIRFLEDSIQLATKLSGTLGSSAKDFNDRAEALSNAFKLGVAEGFINAVNQGLKNTGIGLEQLAAAGIAFGNVMGRIFTAIVNFLTHDIPEGIKTSIEQINTVIKQLNDAADARDRLAQQPSALAPGAAESALLGAGAIGSRIPVIDTAQIQSATQAWVDFTGSVNAATGALELTTQGQREMNAAAQIFHDIVQANEQLFEQTRTPMERYALALDKIAAAHATGELAARAHSQAVATLVGNYLEIADNIATALGTAFKGSKAVAIAQAVINTAQAITKTFAEYGATPWGFALAASMAAIGAAQIATILSTEPGSGSKAIKSPKTGSASASAGASSAGRASAGPTQTVTINIEGEIFGPEHFRKIVAGINGVQQDGTALLRIA